VKVQLIAADVKDIPEIGALAFKIWQNHYPNIIGQAQVDFMLGKLYNENALAAQMQSGQQFYLIRQEDENVGFLAISETKPGNYFLHKFYIETRKHRGGIGTKAFDALLKLIPNAREIKLQVNRQNHKPINFYFKQGFTITEVADFDIGDGFFMNDFIMTWSK